jgi:predicted phage baseplate assembly protein
VQVPSRAATAAGLFSFPKINRVQVQSTGGIAMATHSRIVSGEILPRASGIPGESIQLQNRPLLPRLPDEYLEVQTEAGDWEAWEEVESFRDSQFGDKHYVVDGVSGLIELGPSIRQPNGVEWSFGATPARNAAMRMTRYRFGGGVEGNVGGNTLTVLRSSIPYIARVTNRLPASGGLDPETLEAAKMRAPAALRSQNRAVSASDYEFWQWKLRAAWHGHAASRYAPMVGSSVPPGTGTADPSACPG